MRDDVTSMYQDDIESIQSFCNDLYESNFAKHFSKIHTIYDRMNSSLTSVTDEELEYILIDLPMELISISEKLNTLKLKYEVIKLNNKRKLIDIKNEITSKIGSDDCYAQMTKSEIQAIINKAVSEEMLEYEVMAKAHESVISRVSSEITFSKELIMGAKKVWDSRRSTENVVPVAPTELPEYCPPTNNRYNTYIAGNREV